ncbi:hypothetical protein RIR_jg4018.t1 [Rhizophagus irregularis DAOM 181602=DAOM 197198]|nr:hypothetical protein RIR_jg4018.t1 [Rhizophagus irregularis DAOM 181602=DAOM 197198]
MRQASLHKHSLSLITPQDINLTTIIFLFIKIQHHLSFLFRPSFNELLTLINITNIINWFERYIELTVLGKDFANSMINPVLTLEKYNVGSVKRRSLSFKLFLRIVNKDDISLSAVIIVKKFTKFLQFSPITSNRL